MVLARLRNCLEQISDIRAYSQNSRKLLNRALSKRTLLNKACKVFKEGREYFCISLQVPRISRQKSSSLPLTTTMVNSKNANKLIKNSTLPPGLQDSSKGIGESPDSLNLLSRASSRAGK